MLVCTERAAVPSRRPDICGDRFTGLNRGFNNYIVKLRASSNEAEHDVPHNQDD